MPEHAPCPMSMENPRYLFQLGMPPLLLSCPVGISISFAIDFAKGKDFPPFEAAYLGNQCDWESVGERWFFFRRPFVGRCIDNGRKILEYYCSKY
ncbi:GL20125 [Drosophila persimilis]|uniref:GL20125 n=1 Tax=Drosophila persimilis TaxID=7234 RepID=B4HCT9_DROPE|nr:GL20125 [Drosophila persimilis]